MTPTRRHILGGLAAGTLATARPALGGARPRVVVIGGGFGGVAAARALAAAAIDVTLVEPRERYTTCPASNAVIAGLRPLASITFDYAGLRNAGVVHARERAVAIDGTARTAQLADGTRLAYDRLIVAPGVEMRLDAVSGYDAQALQRMPHAWQAGAQTALLARQLEGLEDGQIVAICVPAMPYRCPPGPYERASLIAHYLKTRKPRSKVIVFDDKDSFSKQPLFEEAWRRFYPDHLEWVPRARGGRLLAVDARAMTLHTQGGPVRAGIANVIPPQRAPSLCFEAGLADAYGWCRIEPVSFESIRVPRIHVIGDASAAGAMPKSAFAAVAQGRLCAQAVADLVYGRSPAEPKLINACYSLVAPDRAVSVTNVYEVEWDALVAMPGIGGTSPLDAPDTFRAQDARNGEAWFRRLTTDLFG